MKKLAISMCCIALLGCETPAEPGPAVEVDRHAMSLEVSPIPEEVTHEAPAWAKLGVARVKTVAAPAGLDHRAVLLDAQGTQIGQLDVSTITDPELGEARRVDTKVGPYHARIELGRGASLRITDLTTGRTGLSRFDPEAKTFSRDPVLERLQADLATIIPLAMGTVAAIESQRRFDEANAAQKKSPIEAIGPAVDALWSCGGYWHRGGAWYGTRSGCCVLARQDAAARCSNWYCYGCCRYLACDVWCSNGDYFCVCGISGQSCG